MATKSIRLSDGTDTLLPESAESASGYQKCADGTLIQWGTITPGVNLSQIGSSGIYYRNTPLDFPIAFSDTNYKVMGSSRFQAGHAFPIGFVVTSQSRATVYVYDLYARSGTMTVQWVAIGRWK